MAQPSFQIDDEVDNWVESRLYPGQSKSIWYRYSVKTTMQIDPMLDKLYDRHQYEERQQFVEYAIKMAVEEKRRELGTNDN